MHVIKVESPLALFSSNITVVNIAPLSPVSFIVKGDSSVLAPGYGPEKRLIICKSSRILHDYAMILQESSTTFVEKIVRVFTWLRYEVSGNTHMEVEK